MTVDTPTRPAPSSQAALQDALGGGQRIATQAATGLGMAKDLKDPFGDQTKTSWQQMTQVWDHMNYVIIY